MTGDQLQTLLDDAVLESAVAERQHRRLLTEADTQDADLAGTLHRMAELGARAVVRTHGGGSLHGRIVEVGEDHATLLDGARGSRVVPLAAMTSIRTRGGEQPPTDADVRVTNGSLAEALRRLAARRDVVHLVTRDGSATTGRITQVGRDVLRVATADGAVLTPLHALAHVGPAHGDDA